MSNFITPNFPASVDGYTSRVANVDEILASDVNQLADAIVRTQERVVSLGSLFEFKTQLTGTQLQNLVSGETIMPLVLIPAPGDNKSLNIVSLVYKVSQGTIEFNMSGILEIGISEAFTSIVPTINLAPLALPLGNMTTIPNLGSQGMVNKPLWIRPLNGMAIMGVTQGNGTLDITILYQIVDTPLPVVSTTVSVVTCNTSSWLIDTTPTHPALRRVEIWESGIRLGQGGLSGTQFVGGWDTVPSLGEHTISYKFYDYTSGGNLILTIADQLITVAAV